VELFRAPWARRLNTLRISGRAAAHSVGISGDAPPSPGHHLIFALIYLIQRPWPRRPAHHARGRTHGRARALAPHHGQEDDEPMSTEPRAAAYHDAHLDDAEEWDDATVETVTPRPSGMTVFSLRLPRDELRLFKQEADKRGMSMSELTRTALRYYVAPRATGSLSATALHHLQVTTYTPVWTGGTADARRVDGLPQVPTT